MKPYLLRLIFLKIILRLHYVTCATTTTIELAWNSTTTAKSHTISPIRRRCFQQNCSRSGDCEKMTDWASRKSLILSSIRRGGAAYLSNHRISPIRSWTRCDPHFREYSKGPHANVVNETHASLPNSEASYSNARSDCTSTSLIKAQTKDTPPRKPQLQRLAQSVLCGDGGEGRPIASGPLGKSRSRTRKWRR